ncbi:sensor histidine kinase [Clostridium sardiniense]|uniref:Sensor histidine kinase n=1 Tax=Clostridium sardiniense TaxID=29369 RepID=A0ABS7KZP8_CLOSR|nr:sensor histidine kinase [Clostridium sardiniense]MBY0756117.1 sensor histidine kinase [Clostridium sardiniense]MDQ0458940.1 two-component system sensor histidine kinase YesM [Clostridium sardiniense]
MGKFKRNIIRSIGIKKRLIFGFLIIPIISMIVIFFIGYKESNKIIKENIDNYSNEMLNIVEENINLNIGKFEQQLDEVLLSPLIYEGLNKSKIMSSTEEYNFANRMNEFLYSKLHLLSSAGEVEILTNDLSILYTQGFKYFKKEDVLKYSAIAQEIPGRTIWFHTQIDGQGAISMSRAIRDPLTKVVNGYIFVALNEKAFGGSFLNVNLDNSASIIVLNERNEYLFGQQKFPYKKIIDLNGDKTIIDSSRYIGNYKDVSKVGWKVVNLVPYESFLDRIRGVLVTLLIYMLTFIALTIILSNYIYKSIYNPINNLVKGMDRAISGCIDANLEDDSNDEIGRLSKQFNGLISKINSLLDEIKYEQELKRESEIKMLQAQINPHFLFNTLNTLKWIAVMNEDTSVSNGLGALAKLLRNTIVDSNEFVTIREEIDNIKSYIVIQKLRYGDSFEVDYHIEEEFYNYKIIKFILQPIIENSILHGFDEDKDNQKIDIIISERNNILEILIKDNGKGFNQHKHKEKKEGKLSGVGYKNVCERIKLTYGKEYTVELKSEIDKGTEVKIMLPVNKDGGELNA